MKEATGELSTTVITIVAIAAISTLFVAIIYPRLRTSIQLNQACNSGPGYDDGTVCCKTLSGSGCDGYSGAKSKVCNPDEKRQYTCYVKLDDDKE